MKHKWKLDKDGNVNEWVWEEGFHNGVICERCGKSVCVNCTPNYMDLDDCVDRKETEMESTTYYSNMEYLKHETTYSPVETTKHEKIKTPYARVIVEVINDKPYFEIQYYDTKKEEMCIGYGSYCIEYTLKDLKENFEIEKPMVDVRPVFHSKWEKLDSTQVHYCIDCGASFNLYSYCKNDYNYCPFCGAKMDLEVK